MTNSNMTNHTQPPPIDISTKLSKKLKYEAKENLNG